jgi:hypothetical protein
VASLAALASGASCARSFRNPFKAWSPPAPDVLVGASSLDQIIAAVNQNSQKIVSYQTTNATITVPGTPGVPALRGNIAAQRPGRVRLEASTALTGKEVDLGSNDELFWVWLKRSEPPALYLSRHDRYAGSAAQQFLPIEPQWLLDALGLAELRPTDFHEGPTPIGKARVEIKSVVQSASGPLTKRTVIDARKAWVVEQHVYDRNGTLLASAAARSHRYYEGVGVSLPQEIDIQIPATGLSLSIDVGTVTINGPMDNQALWTLPAPPGAPVVDLGAAPPNSPGGGPAKLGDQMTRADWYGPTAAAAPPSVMDVSPAPAMAVAMSAPVGAPAPQFVPPGGQRAAVADPFGPSTAPEVQRLPVGGVAAQPVFSR